LIGLLFPVFLGAEELPTYQKYLGPIKPGVVITKKNWDKYLPELQKLLPPSKIKWYGTGVKNGLVTMPIVKTTYNLPTKGQREAIRKYVGTARAGTNNALLNWAAGIPFPEPKNALEISWNSYPSIGRAYTTDDLIFHGWFGLFKGSNYEKHFVWEFLNRKYHGRTDIPPLGNMPQFTDRGISYKESLLIYEPNEMRGFLQLRIRYWDINKVDESYAYLPSLRRVRRLTGSDLTDPLLGSDYIPDDGDVMRQKINSGMKFTVLEYKDFLVPRTILLADPPQGMKNKPPYNYKNNGNCFQVEWEIRPQWVVEVMINNPDYVYSKRINYIDAVPVDQGGQYTYYWGEQYDQKGRLWKANGVGAPGANKEGSRCMLAWGYINFLTDHYTIMDVFYPAFVEGFDKIYPLKEDEAFSIKGLLKRAQ